MDQADPPAQGRTAAQPAAAAATRRRVQPVLAAVLLAFAGAVSAQTAEPAGFDGLDPVAAQRPRAALESPASSAPAGVQAATDPLLQLLHERGLLAANEARASDGVVQQVRDQASEMVLSAMQFVGVNYRRGGSSAEEGFDCSGFTRHVFEHSLGLLLPRRADEQARSTGLAPVRRDELRPGDLVFFNTLRRAFSHVGIYVGGGKFIHAPRSGAQVRIEDMRQAYWARRFNGARRAPLPAVTEP